MNAQFKPHQPSGQDLVRNVTVIYGHNPGAFETGPHVVLKKSLQAQILLALAASLAFGLAAADPGML